MHLSLDQAPEGIGAHEKDKELGPWWVDLKSPLALRALYPHMIPRSEYIYWRCCREIKNIISSTTFNIYTRSFQR